MNLTNDALKDALIRIDAKYNLGTSPGEREIDFFHSDGYGSPGCRTIFFCVKGSPNKWAGCVKDASTVSNHESSWCIISNHGEFNFKGKVIRKKRFYGNCDNYPENRTKFEDL